MLPTILVGIDWIISLLCVTENLRPRVGNDDLYRSLDFLLRPSRVSYQDRTRASASEAIISSFLLLETIMLPSICILFGDTAMLFTNYFAMAVEMLVVSTDRYRWPIMAVGGSYLALGIAIIAGFLLPGRVSGWHHAK